MIGDGLLHPVSITVTGREMTAVVPAVSHRPGSRSELCSAWRGAWIPYGSKIEFMLLNCQEKLGT
jgi:hypothetical protein